MTNEIKEIIHNFLSKEKLCSFTDGTVVADGVRISDKFVVPNDILVGNLKNTIIAGQKVRLLRNNGGQQYYIMEVISE